MSHDSHESNDHGKPEARQLVPVTLPSGIQPYAPLGQFSQFWANWRPDDREGKTRLFKSFQQVELSADDVLGQPIQVTHVLVHPIDITKEDTGEVIACHRTVLHLDDGTAVAFVSQGILKSLSLVCMLEGEGPWKPGLGMVIRQVKLKNARRTYTVELTGEEPSDKQAKKTARDRK